jgi:hypothetical protein
MLKLGWKMGDDESSIWIKKDDMKIEFDIQIPTPKGYLYVMYMKRNEESVNESESWSTRRNCRLGKRMAGSAIAAKH